MDRPDLKNLELDIRDSIATISLNRPKALNVFNLETLDELEKTLDYLKDEKAVKVVVIRSNSEKVFTAGADITHMHALDVEGGRDFAVIGHRIARKIEGLPQPVIAALNGFVFGGGVELSSACDIRIASEDLVFSQPEIDIGVIPGWGGTQRLIKHIGPGRAKEMIFTGKRVTAQEALDIGFVNHVVPRNELDNTARSLAEIIATKSRLVLEAAKRSINITFEVPLSEGCEYEIESWAKLFSSHDQKEGMRAFLEKRQPKFKDE